MDLYIYILTHPKFEGWIKIGRAINIEKRLHSYQTGCPTRSYKIEYSRKVSLDLINNIEIFFKVCIHSNGYEWYKISVDEGINIIEKLVKGDDLYDNSEYKIILASAKRHSYNQKFKYYAYEDIDEYSYLEKKEFNKLDDLFEYFKFNTSDSQKICKLFQSKSKIKIKNIVIQRQKFKKVP